MHTMIRDRSRKKNRRGETLWLRPGPVNNHIAFLKLQLEASFNILASIAYVLLSIFDDLRMQVKYSQLLDHVCYNLK